MEVETGSPTDMVLQIMQAHGCKDLQVEVVISGIVEALEIEM